MDKIDTTEKMIHYITNSQISIDQIVRDTHISESKLRGETKEKLKAAEFLSLCQYLNVRPEEFRQGWDIDTSHATSHAPAGHSMQGCALYI